MSTSSPKRARGSTDEWIDAILEETLLNQRRRAMERLRPLIEKKRRGEKLSKKDIEEGMKVLCYGHFCFCCGLKKRCGYRDSLLKALGLTRKDYTDYKDRCKRLFWRVLREKKVI